MINLAAKYAKEHQHYLKVQHPQVYQDLKASGELESRSAKIGEQAEELYHVTIKRMTEIYQKMPKDRPGKEAYLSQAPLTAEEIVRSELVYGL